LISSIFFINACNLKSEAFSVLTLIVLIVLTEELGVIPTFPCGACSYMVNPPLIRLIFCLAHLSSNMSVLASVSISSNVRKGMFIFNATFLEALYSYLFVYGALLNASSLWFVFFCIF